MNSLKSLSLIMLVANCLFLPPKVEDEILVMFWNCENFFDWYDSGFGESDNEFSSRGSRHWTRKRFNAKCQVFAKSVLWIAQQRGRLPDIIGLAEIENSSVLRSMINETVLRKLDYRYVHYDSPDPRGIDCALLYRSSVLDLSASRAVPVKTDSAGRELNTRDILLAEFNVINHTSCPKQLAVMVNHHPSKYKGGEDWRRVIAINRLCTAVDSLSSIGNDFILAIGDFNDTPDNSVFSQLESRLKRVGDRGGYGEGSIKFNGQWQYIDLAFASDSLWKYCGFESVRIPFLIVRDAAHSGEKPLRTYSGPRYLGGFSDHCPVLVEIRP